MTYEPTGNPPGRPRKDGSPAGSKPLPKHAAPEANEPVALVSALDHRPLSVAHSHPCPECFPNVGTKWNALACAHGEWINR